MSLYGVGDVIALECAGCPSQFRIERIEGAGSLFTVTAVPVNYGSAGGGSAVD